MNNRKWRIVCSHRYYSKPVEVRLVEVRLWTVLFFGDIWEGKVQKLSSKSRLREWICLFHQQRSQRVQIQFSVSGHNRKC